MVDVSSYRQTERPPWKCFKCGSEYHTIAKCPKQVCLNEKVNYACDNGENDSDCEIYAYMAQMSSNFPFVIARYSCHICIYLAVTIIFAVVACIITFFNKTYVLWTFFDHVIFRSISKAFPRQTFHFSKE